MADRPTFDEIREIKDRVKSIERTQEVLVRAQEGAILKSLWLHFDNDDILAQIYLLVDSRKTQQEIARILNKVGARGGSEATVSRRMDMLRELGLVELVDKNRSGKVYGRTAVDQILGVARKLERRRGASLENG